MKKVLLMLIVAVSFTANSQQLSAILPNVKVAATTSTVVKPQLDAFQTDLEAIFGDTTGSMYQYVISTLRGNSDSASKLSTLVSELQAFQQKYGTPQEILTEMGKRPQPWNQTCNIICAGMYWGCTSGCHARDYFECVELCSRRWKDCARFCNVWFPDWPDAPKPKP
jgi:hypothetical protein